jgi:SH3 domain-containing YSC84-like protein 1
VQQITQPRTQMGEKALNFKSHQSTAAERSAMFLEEGRIATMKIKAIGGLFIALMLFSAVALRADDEKKKQEDRLQNAGVVMNEILNIPDNIPQDLLDKAKCVVVIPSVLKAAFIVGANYGRGTMVCRQGEDYRGPWGAPAMMGLEGGSFGLQAGADATDFVLLIMDDHGASSLLSNKVKLGADATAAAGPVGRAAEADTDAYMRAEILTYSRARGLFAGVSLEGAALFPDTDANDALYGRKIPARDIVRGPNPPSPPVAAQQLIGALERSSPNLKAANQ